MEGKRFYIVWTAICLALWWTDAVADDATLTWTNPTGTETCQDSTAPLELAGTKIYRLIADVADPTQTQYIDENLPPGEYEYVAVSYDVAGENSRVSGAATKTSAAFTANAGLFAYAISQTGDQIVLYPVGTVTADVDCDVGQSVNGMHRIPKDAVTYETAQRPVTVFAECG